MSLDSVAANTNSPKWAKFDILEKAYKVVNGHDIPAFVMVPKGIKPGNHPLVGKFHGGFLVTGASLFAEWFPQWLLDYCLEHSAIIVAADHRLLPEARGTDILEDVSDFWTWVRSDLQKHLTVACPGVELDHGKTLAVGESAGGYLAIQSGLLQPPGSVKAVLATYPMTEMTTKYTKPIFGTPPPPLSIFEDHLKSIKTGDVVTSANPLGAGGIPLPLGRMPLALSITFHGRYEEIFGTEDTLYPMRVLNTAKNLPYMQIMHGKEDSAVPVEGSIVFAEAVKQKFGASKIDLILRPGEHGFDHGEAVDGPWLSEALTRVTKAWLG